MQSSHISQLQLREEQNHKHSFCKGRRPSFTSQGPKLVCVTSSPRQNTERGLIQTACTFPSGRSLKRSNEPKHALRFWFLLGKSYPPKKSCSVYKVCWLISFVPSEIKFMYSSHLWHYFICRLHIQKQNFSVCTWKTLEMELTAACFTKLHCTGISMSSDCEMTEQLSLPPRLSQPLAARRFYGSMYHSHRIKCLWTEKSSSDLVCRLRPEEI